MTIDYLQRIFEVTGHMVTENAKNLGNKKPSRSERNRAGIIAVVAALKFDSENNYTHASNMFNRILGQDVVYEETP